MNEFKGSKGNWKLWALDNQRCYQIKSNGKIICDAVYFNAYDFETKEISTANALLISKAPEMLEMLERFKKINNIAKEHIAPKLFKDLEQLIKEATTL
jgi:hypothetical protein